MKKILTAKIREYVYNSLISRGLFPKEPKGCLNWTRCTGEHLYIDQHILKDGKTRRQNLTMEWIDYKKAYDLIPQSWIIDSIKMYKISDEVMKFIENVSQNCEENPERDLPERCIINITTCDSDAYTQSDS